MRFFLSTTIRLSFLSKTHKQMKCRHTGHDSRLCRISSTPTCPLQFYLIAAEIRHLLPLTLTIPKNSFTYLTRHHPSSDAWAFFFFFTATWIQRVLMQINPVVLLQTLLMSHFLLFPEKMSSFVASFNLFLLSTCPFHFLLPSLSLLFPLLPLFPYSSSVLNLCHPSFPSFFLSSTVPLSSLCLPFSYSSFSHLL